MPIFVYQQTYQSYSTAYEPRMDTDIRACERSRQRETYTNGSDAAGRESWHAGHGGVPGFGATEFRIALDPPQKKATFGVR